MTRQCLTKLNPKEYLPVWSMQMPGSVRTGTTDYRELNNWQMGSKHFASQPLCKRQLGGIATMAQH